MKLLFRLALVALVALAAYALFAELPAPREEVRIELDEPPEG